MRKTKLFAFLLMLLTIFSVGVTLKANGSSITMVDGAAIRTTGEQGLRFTATLSENYSGDQHGFYIIYGEATIADLEDAKANLVNEKIIINDKEVFEIFVPGLIPESTQISVVLIGIPQGGYEDNITVLAFFKQDNNITYSNNVTTRNVADVARATYNSANENYTGDFKDVIDSIALPRRIKVIHSDNSFSYYGDFDNNFTLTDGANVELVRGVYEKALTVDVDNVSIYSYNRDIVVDNNGARQNALFEEAIYRGSGGITVGEGVKYLTVNGLSFTRNRGLHFMGDNSDIIILNNIFDVTGNWIIRDEDNSNLLLENIYIIDNYFASSATYSRDIYFQGFVKSLYVYNNFFESPLKAFNTNDYAIRLMKFADGAEVDIYGNNFNKLASNYVIDIGYNMGVSNARTINHKINLNIEDNCFTPHYLTSLLGNGIRMLYLGDNSTVSIVGNSAIRTSTYYNAILISGGNAANYSDTIDNLKVEILHNKFYVPALDDVIKPPERTASTSRFTRIGLGIPVTADLTIDNNYFGSSTSRYAYTLPTSSGATGNNNQAVLTNNSAEGSAEANSGYEALINDFSIRVNNYLNNSFENVSSALYNGLEERDITIYIPNFNPIDANEIEIQDGKLVYVGRNLYFKRIAKEVGIEANIILGIERLSDIIVNLAKIYFEQGDSIQYDQTSGRRMIEGSP